MCLNYVSNIISFFVHYLSGNIFLLLLYPISEKTICGFLSYIFSVWINLVRSLVLFQKKIFIGLSLLYRASFFNWGLNFYSIFFLPLIRSYFSLILFPIYSFNYLKMSKKLLCCSFASLLSVTDNVYFVLFLRLTTFAYVHIFLA